MGISMLILLLTRAAFGYASTITTQPVSEQLRGSTKIQGADSVTGNPGQLLNVNPDGSVDVSSTSIRISFQYPTVIATNSPNITTVSVGVIAANLKRHCLMMYNNSANSAYVTFGSTSNSSTPTFIFPSFSNFQMISGPVYTGTISAIRNAGSGQITVYECIQ